MSIRLNHIGVAVENLPKLQTLFSMLGIHIQRSEPVPDQGVMTHFLPISADNDSAIELLEASDPQGTVAKFIKNRGPGIHHLSFRVPSGKLESLCSELKKNGIRLIYDEPREGAHGMKINFIHPSSAGGILLEVMEKA